MRPTALAIVLLFAVPFSLHARNRTEASKAMNGQDAALVTKAVQHEAAILAEIRKSTPIVETYIQRDAIGDGGPGAPVSDYYFISRATVKKALNADIFIRRDQKKTQVKRGIGDISTLVRTKNGVYQADGFLDMVTPNQKHFDLKHYTFSYAGHEFLGSVRTHVFDVAAIKPFPGSFTGRVWIEDEGGNIVRFDGTFQGDHNPKHPRYLHFASWRTNVQPGLWLPSAIFTEDTVESTELKAVTHFWGYSLVNARGVDASDNTSIRVDNAEDMSKDSPDVSPIEASHLWYSLAEKNILNRLTASGVVAPDSSIDAVLQQIATNIMVPNDISFSSPVHCRVILTAPLEATTAGDTILLSKGLIDSMPNEESLASIIAMEIAHLELGHRVDTAYAFSDRLQFQDDATYLRLKLRHSDKDNTAAAAKAVELLKNSIYAKKLTNAGLFYEQLAVSAKALHSLADAQLGDSLLNRNGVPWMATLETGAPKLMQSNLSQVAALPLGSNTVTNPWTDRVRLIDATRYAPTGTFDKLPFEVTPVYYRLARYGSTIKQVDLAGKSE
ncbi:MAG: M48 family metalloprotease [Acidobacteriaceae bacterium]